MQKIILFLIAVLCQVAFIYSQSSISPHFTIEKLDDGVWAAIAKNGGYAICNAGIVDLGDATLIFDPFMTPEAAEDLKKIALELTGRPVNYVVNSHYHNDHVGGNQVFEGAAIISTQRTRELMAKFQPEEIEFGKTGAPARLETMNAENTSGMTPHALEEHNMMKGFFEAYVTSANNLRIVLPTMLVSHDLTIMGPKQSAQFLTYGAGHTESDLFLYLPEKKILFLGDILFIENQPWLSDGDMNLWITTLDSIKKFDSNKIVPGHGPVGTKADIDTMVKYIQHIQSVAISCKQKGTPPDMESSLIPPPPYDTWYLSMFYKPNIKYAYGLIH